MYDQNTIYLIGTSKLTKSDPITSAFEIFFIGLIIDRKSHKIVDSTCNVVKEKTEAFINDLLIGFDLLNDLDKIETQIFERYHGIAQKALAAAIKDAANKYKMIVGQSLDKT